MHGYRKINHYYLRLGPMENLKHEVLKYSRKDLERNPTCMLKRLSIGNSCEPLIHSKQVRVHGTVLGFVLHFCCGSCFRFSQVTI